MRSLQDGRVPGRLAAYTGGSGTDSHHHALCIRGPQRLQPLGVTPYGKGFQWRGHSDVKDAAMRGHAGILWRIMASHGTNRVTMRTARIAGHVTAAYHYHTTENALRAIRRQRAPSQWSRRWRREALHPDAAPQPNIRTRETERRFVPMQTVGQALRGALKRVGEDWIFLFLLGISMATISFGLDVTIAKLQRVNLWMYDALEYRYLQYFSWVLYHILLMTVSAAVAKYIAPQAAVTIRSDLRRKVLVFGMRGNPSRKYDLLIAGAAVGVACCFVAPVGGVLFSVETTATHFAVRNYWRGFFAATCAALMFRLLAVINSVRETVAILFSTNWQVEFPFDLPEYLSYAILGAVCGCVCGVYLYLHRVSLVFINSDGRIGRFLRNK
ncbi:hypothetical protein GDO78_015957 [Eleutherodactylus coqui]|uniref:Chloride channel protein n=1 Tax=Eleutherodactylus coqui TaxID=57060 RepID=A0A8J6BKB3_ELECQ|nr:hypothetical protein GDO78_015957 [Eleutherodactylus coqui]